MRKWKIRPPWIQHYIWQALCKTTSSAIVHQPISLPKKYRIPHVNKNTLIPTFWYGAIIKTPVLLCDNPPWYLRLAALEACTVMLLEVIYGWVFGPWKAGSVDWFLKKWERVRIYSRNFTSWDDLNQKRLISLKRLYKYFLVHHVM